MSLEQAQMDQPPLDESERSEPCSARTNPFTDRDATTSRKRQKTSREGARSVSLDATADQDIPTTSSSPSNLVDITVSASPHTPPSMSPDQATGPASSKVTINLRTASSIRNLRAESRSPTRKMPDVEDMRTSVETESDALSNMPPVETPSSSPSTSSSPRVEVVSLPDAESDYDNELPVTIIGEDDEYEETLEVFPGYREGETTSQTVLKIIRYLQFDEIEDSECFSGVSNWIDQQLKRSMNPATFYDMYSQDPEVWVKIPEVLNALSRRSRFFGGFLQRSRESRQALTDVFTNFARLAGRFLAMDVGILESPATKAKADFYPDPISHVYLRAYSFLIRKGEASHIGHNLEMHYSWDWDADLVLIQQSFEQEGGNIDNLSRFVSCLAHYLDRNPKLAEQFTEPCQIVAKAVVEFSSSNVLRNAFYQRSLSLKAKQVLGKGHLFFKTMMPVLDLILEKYGPNISSEAVVVHLATLTDIHINTLLKENPETSEILVRYAKLLPEISPHSQLVKAIVYKWKFPVLHKLLTSNQMQFRVIGITTMCTDLLHLFTLDKERVAPDENPLLLYFASLLIKADLLDYIMGVGSHPEIISESNNIIGFLIVTKTYTRTHTDRIWQTVMLSQDPRVVTATIRMQQRLLHLLDLSQLYYICSKINELPLHAFTPAMRDFCCKIIDSIVAKQPNDLGIDIPKEPYDFCIRLIRESLVPNDEGTVQHYDLSTFALLRLKSLVEFGPGLQQRRSIYASCVQDIASASPTSWGSICLLNLFLQRYPDDLSHLTEDHDLIQLLVQKLEESNTRRRGSTMSVKSIDYDVAPTCLEILMLVITNLPEQISTNLGLRLWNALVGDQSTTVIHHNQAWSVLNNALRKSRSNCFLQSCFKLHFSELPATCLSNGSLEFAKAMIDIWLEDKQRTSSEEIWSLDSFPLEQLWRLVLLAIPHTIDSAAIKILVSVHVDNDLMLTLPRANARAIHETLIHRCLRQLESAASNLRRSDETKPQDGKSVVKTDSTSDGFVQQEMVFTRSLSVLHEFLGIYQSKPQFAIPKPLSLSKEAITGIQGEPVEVKYQSFDGNLSTEVKTLKLGRLSTAATLLAGLQEATGFKNYKVYYRGKALDATGIDVCQSLADLDLNSDSGLLLVHRREYLEGSTSKPMISLEMEVMKHMNNLWGYLGMHDKVAQEIYHFLVRFPVYDTLTKLLQQDSVSYLEIFPIGKVFKSLYAVHVLRQMVVLDRSANVTQRPFLERALLLVTSALINNEMLASIKNKDLQARLAISLLDCMVQILREDGLPATAESILGTNLSEKLLILMLEACTINESTSSAHLTCKLFDAMLEASQRSTIFWMQFSPQLKKPHLLQQILLQETRSSVRKNIIAQIIQRCTQSSANAKVSKSEFVATFWPAVVSLIPETTRMPEVCEELFTLTLALFKDANVNGDLISELVNEWAGLLLISADERHSSGEQFECPDFVDPVAFGLACLLQAGALIAKSSHHVLSCAATGTKLFVRILFPDLLDETELASSSSPRLPVLHAGTRERLLEAVYFMVKDDEVEYDNVIAHLATLTPYSPQEDNPYAYELSWAFDRLDAIRSATGYVGLRNLSNTCYLNSLFTQLFMNLPFREFMLQLEVAEEDEQERLLVETQKLFGNMQNSLCRYVDPHRVAGSIQTYDLSKIDVSVQMDVDEFYNLLFDRWEAQLQSSVIKQKFKSFYGGQLVHQIKSKECHHVSEREESFSAIQCDIKGKTCLQESLQAYVEGEVMEGENKYKCSTCDRHVDAVKRARLKQIPDNLIFHLKRFDFNLRTLQRSKINDHFSFPEVIDMRPYTMDYVDNVDPAQQDIFELVGVLVHSGTAESGHYYSYTRERPSKGSEQTWVEFNDEIVTPWDHNTLETCCFGGPDIRPGGDTGFDKSYSAYMLFYQRSSAILSQQHGMNPARRFVPAGIASLIAMDNELTLRKYCLYEPAQTLFVSRILSNMRKLNGGICTSAHNREKNVLQIVFNHLDQVVARTKELPQFAGFLSAINRACQTCAECSRDYIDWLTSCSEALRMLLVRNPDVAVRSEIGSSIFAALKKIKSDAAYAYGFEDDQDSMEAPPQALLHFADGLLRLYDSFHMNTRAWPEYFGLLSDIASLGTEESAVLLDRDFLRKTLFIICADPLLPSDPQYQKMWNNVTKRMATRPVSYDAVISLLFRLLQSCDITLEPTAIVGSRLKDIDEGYAIALTQGERHLLVQQWTRTESNILVEKLLRINQNEFAIQSIIKWLLKWSAGLGEVIEDSIHRAILIGIQRSSVAPPAGPFLRAALTYCEHDAATISVCSTIEEVARAASIDTTEGKEFVNFFRDVVNLVDDDKRTSRDDVIRAVIENVGLWAPNLLTSYEAPVRESTDALVHDLLLEHEQQVNFEDEEDERVQLVLNGTRALGSACLDFIYETYLQQRVAAVRATLLNIQVILEECSHYFSADDSFHNRYTSVIQALRKCEVDDVEEETSGWEASDYPSSEADLNELDTGL